jgi:hypothetical protein
MGATQLMEVPSSDVAFYNFLCQQDRHPAVLPHSHLSKRLEFIRLDLGSVGRARSELTRQLALRDIRTLSTMSQGAKEILAYNVGIWLGLKSDRNPFSLKAYVHYLAPVTPRQGLHFDIEGLQAEVAMRGPTVIGQFLKDILMGSLSREDAPESLHDGDRFTTPKLWTSWMKREEAFGTDDLASTVNPLDSLYHRSITEAGSLRAPATAQSNASVGTKRTADSQAERFTEMSYLRLTEEARHRVAKGLCFLCGHVFDANHRCSKAATECPVYRRNPHFRETDRVYFAVMVSMGSCDPSGPDLKKRGVERDQSNR